MVYVDTSVLLRLALDEPQPLSWIFEQADLFTSEIARVECARVIDRIRFEGSKSLVEQIELQEFISTMLNRFQVVEINRAIIQRSQQPLPVVIRSLDAIHLSTAQLVRDSGAEGLRLATHDRQFALAARCVGFEVLGV